MPSLEARPPCPLSSLLLLLLVLLLAASVATSQDDDMATEPTWLDCGTDTSQPPPPTLPPSPAATSQPPQPSTTNNSSVFRANLLALLEALPRAAAPTGFASLSFGTGRDRAFVRGLCRGDSAPPECLATLQVAVRNLSGSCASSRRAAVWFDKCYLTYADTNVSTSYEEIFQSVLVDSRKLADPDSFEQTYYTLMGRLVARAASGGGGDSARMFATGEAEYSRDDPNGTMYGLVQCMRDRSAGDCDRCLQNSVKEFPACCRGQQGGVVLSYNCYLRIQIYTYYNLALDAPPPASPPPPVPSPPPPAGESHSGKNRPKRVMLAVAFATGTLLVLVVVLVGFYLRIRASKKRPRATDNNNRGDGSASCTYVHPDKFTLPLLRAATGNFAAENKLGEGGFGQVFRGELPDGQAIAVKRLSKSSSQGFHELKNELVLAAKLRHRNLVQLLGVCLEEKEKLVVYEYLPNRSLDTLLFGTSMSVPCRPGRHVLDWRRRYRIITGIARGLLYLHEESRLRVIHRDLKPSNVLLDEKMNPKISDFGLARAFRGDQSRDVTKRPAGTLGYMSPEYAYCGHVSTKSDMFSFGVIVLEIVTGRRSNGGPCQDAANGSYTKNLLSDVWEKWRTGSAAEVADASLGGQYPRGEVACCVQIGLLCVQKKPELRPGASSVVLMLDSQSTSLQTPSRPAFYAGGSTSAAPRVGRSRRSLAAVSENGVTMSEIEPR